MKFIHAADIHLDSPLRGLPDYEGAPTEEVRSATRFAFRNLIDLAIEEIVDFIIISGDLYDGDWRDFNTGLFFVAEMARLKKANIPVYLVLGNHDAESRITKSLTLPDNVYQFSSRKVETKIIADLKVALHGQSFSSADTKENLAAHYPLANVDCFNIGILHTAAEGRDGHAPYAPCSVSELVSKGYDYWALGHVHKREVLYENPFVVFPGNLQGRHARETASEGKGCTVVTVDESGNVELLHRDVDTVRWTQVEINLSGVPDFGGLIERVRKALEKAYGAADGRLLAARLIFTGDTKIHGRLLSDRENLLAEIRGAGLEVATGDIWIEKAVIQTRPEVSLDQLAERKDVLGEVSKELQALSNDAEFRSALVNSFDDLFSKLPSDLTIDAAVEDGLRRDEDAISELLDLANNMVLTKLSQVGTE